VTGVPLAEDSALLDAGLDLALSDRLSAGVLYSGQYADVRPGIGHAGFVPLAGMGLAPQLSRPRC